MSYLTGHIQLPANAPTGKAAIVRVELRDVSLADAPSTVVVEQVLKSVRLAPGAKIPFRLAMPMDDPSRRLALRAHVDINGTGRTLPGDLLTTQSYPVTVETDSADISVTLL